MDLGGALTYLALYTHVAATALWMGGGMLMTFVVRPSLAGLSAETRRDVLERIGAVTDPYFLAVGWIAVVAGAVSGVLTQRAHEALGLESRWGWAIALGAAISLAMVAHPTRDMLGDVRGLLRGRSLTEITGRPPVEPRPLARLRGVRREGWLRSAGFVVALALMSLARLS